ncbi:MAG: hypothetical protein JXR40_01030 [Pontiellaceae bacterium]|nr:hypothetical protein [Pontiellaceae bacterium]
MSSPLVMGSNVLAFIPSSAHVDDSPAEMVDTEALEREIRAELEMEYAQRLQREASQRALEERRRFDQALNQYISGVDKCIASMRKEIQTKVIDLSLRMAEIIVRHELPDREMLHNLIVKTLEPVSELKGAVVRISSHDWKLFGEQIATGDHLGVGSTVQFAEDPNLSAGDVIVESRNGIFDARLNERLKLLKESLNERSGRKSTEQSKF